MGFKIEISDKAPSRKRTQNIEFSNVMPLWRFIFLYVISFGTYEIFWAFKNWQYIKEHYKLRIFPFARSIFSQFFIYSLFKKILILAKEKGYTKTYLPSVMAAIYIGIFLLSGYANTNKDIVPKELWILPVISFIPFIPAVNAINFYWQQEQPNKPIRNGFSKGELIFIGIFGVLFILNVVRFIEEYTTIL